MWNLAPDRAAPRPPSFSPRPSPFPPRSRFSAAFLPSFVLALAWTLAMLALPAPAAAGHETLEQVRLQLSWHHQFQFAGYYAALERGFYREAGLDVRIVEGGQDLDRVGEVVAGPGRYGVHNARLVGEYLHGAPVKALAAIMQHSPVCLMSRDDSGVRTVRGLRGRRVALHPSLAPEIAAMLIAAGVNPAELDLVRHPGHMASLIHGDVDAAAAYLTNEPFLLRRAGVPVHILRPADFGIDFYSDVLFTSEDEARRFPDRARRMRDASLRGWRYALANPDEIISLILAKYAPDKSREQLEFEAAAMRGLIRPDMVPLGAMVPERWQHIASVLERLHLAPAGDAGGLIFNAADAVRSQRIRRILWYAGVAGGAGLLAALALFALYLRLRRDFRDRSAALERSEATLRQIVDLVPHRISVKDAEGRFLMANKALADALGLPMERLVGMDIRDIAGVNPTVEAVLRGDLQVIETGRALIAAAVPMRDPGGREGWFHISRVPFTAPGMDGRAVLTMAVDITEQRDLAHTLELERDTAAIFLDRTPALVLGLGPGGRILTMNPAAEAASGYRAADVIDESWWDLVFPGELHAQAEQLRRDLAEGDVRDRRMEMLAGDGTPRTVSWTTYRRAETDGQPGTTVLFGHDITARLRAEQESRALRNRLADIVNSMPSALIGVDGEGRVIQWNLEAERMIGIPAGRALSLSLEEALPLARTELDALRLALRQDAPRVLPKRARVVDGETRYVDVTVYPLATSGEGAVIRLDDVTERVRLEEIMVQTEKMMSVGGLAAGMAHEINNPLGVIHQGVQGAVRRLSPELPANRVVADELGVDLERVGEYLRRRDIDQYLDGIRDAATRAAAIVQNMLNFSRKSESRREVQAPADLLDKAVALASSDYNLKKKYDFRQVSIAREYDPATPPVHVIGTEIEQVLLNLLKNAAEAMGDAPDPARRPQITLRTRPDGDAVRIEVEDNGPGMSEKVRRRLFEPFFTTKPVGVGTGLGLSVSYFIVTRNHGGHFNVESAPGAGTRFIIHLPAHRHDDAIRG